LFEVDGIRYNESDAATTGGIIMATTAERDERISRIGHEIYETQLRPKVETDENIGKLIAIDIKTGDYEIGDKLITAVERLQARRPDAEIWSERIGYNAVYAVGGSLHRVDR
jgi:hypothetical protein